MHSFLFLLETLPILHEFCISLYSTVSFSFRFLSGLISASFEYSFIYLIITNLQCNCQCWIVPDRKQPEAVFLGIHSGFTPLNILCSVSISLWLFIVLYTLFSCQICTINMQTIYTFTISKI